MTCVVYERYPVWKLPEDRREGFDPDGYVMLTIEYADERRKRRKSGETRNLPEIPAATAAIIDG